MAEKILQSELAIKATDRTGRAFESVSASVKRLVSDMKSLQGATARVAQIPATLHKVDHTVHKLAAAAAGTYAAGKLAQGMAHVVQTYKEFDDITRYQRAITGMSIEQQQGFIDQAIHMGGSTPFNDIKVLHAQLDLMQRGVKTEFIKPITQYAGDFAQAMNADLPEAAKTIEGILFSTQKHIQDGNEALKVARRTVDYAVKLAKIGGLDNEDITQLFKYAGFSGSMAGLSDESIGAMAAMMRRSNIRGDEAGVAIRSIAGTLVAPNRPARGALMSMGIDWNKFAKMPDALSVDRLALLIQSTYGKALPGGMRGSLGGMLGDQELLGNKGEFIEKVSGALGPLFAGKGGKIKAQDAHNIAKTVGSFYQMATQSVDSEGLLRAIMGAKPTLAQANALFGQKQGARAMAAMGNPELFGDFWTKLHETPEGFAHQIAVDRMAGFSGALQRAEGGLMNLWTALGRANDPALTALFDRAAQIAQSLAELNPKVLQLWSEVALATTALIAFRAALATFALGRGLLAVGGLPGGGAGPGVLNTVSKAAGLAGLLYALYETIAPQPAGTTDADQHKLMLADPGYQAWLAGGDKVRKAEVTVKVEAAPGLKASVSGSTGSLGKSMSEITAPLLSN